MNGQSNFPNEEITPTLVGVNVGATSINPHHTPSTPSTPGTIAMPDSKFSVVPIIGQQIGPYKILAELGSGGMGSVYLVEQREPVKRQVALKLLHGGLNSEDMLNRFRAEGDALARMNHPNIAQIFDFSAAPDGRLFFAMEYVPGVPLVQFCNKRGMELRQRLELFLQVCEGIQHAHQKGVIHRDIKPTNLLVADYQGQLVVKVIDFGIAKKVDDYGLAEVGTTLAGMPIGTPAYMSPEQADSDQGAIDTRSDVYALGGVLYKLLTDELPVPSDQIHRAMQTGLGHFLRHVVVIEPSKCVQNLALKPNPDWPIAMHGEYHSIARKLRGDLDWITLKALSRERERRYASVSEFAADIRRHLAGETVLASPPTRSYRIQKFVARNRIAVATSAAVVASLIFGIIGTTRMTIEARAQRARAETALVRAESERERAVATKAFLEDMIASPDPWKLVGSDSSTKDIKVVEALIAAGNKIGGHFDQDAGLRSEVSTLLGRTLRRLGQFQQARLHLERAVADAEKVLQPSDPKRLQAKIELAILEFETGNTKLADNSLTELIALLPGAVNLDVATEEEARRTLSHTAIELGQADRAELIARENLKLMLQRHGDHSAPVSGARANLADILGTRGAWKEANHELDLAYEDELKRMGPTHPSVLSLQDMQASLALREGRYDDAEKRFRRTAILSEQMLGIEHANTLRVWSQVATALADGGKPIDAITIYQRIIPIRTQILGPDHSNVLTMRANYAIALRAAGKKTEAAVEFNDIFERRKRVLGELHPETIRSLNMLASSAKDRGDFVAAEKYYQQAVLFYEQISGRNHPDTILTENYFLAVKRELGRAVESIPDYADLLKRAQIAMPANHWYIASIQSNYGLALLANKQFDLAEIQLRASYDSLRGQFDSNDARVVKAKERLDAISTSPR